MPKFDFDKEVDDIRNTIKYTQLPSNNSKVSLKKILEEVVKSDALAEFAGIRISQLVLQTSLAIHSTADSPKTNQEVRLLLERLEKMDRYLSDARERLGSVAYYLRQIALNEQG